MNDLAYGDCLDDLGPAADMHVAKRVTRPDNACFCSCATELLNAGVTQQNVAEEFEVSRTSMVLGW